MIGVGAVLVVAAAVVLVGLYITQYRPPRAHILTVEGTDYSAAEVKSRGSYMLRFERDFAEGVTQETLVDRTIERIVRDEVLRRRAPAFVGEVTTDDLEQELRVRLGFASASPTPGASPAPGSAATPAATPTEAATPDEAQREQQEADFAQARQELYRSGGMGREALDNVLIAGMLQQRLSDQFQSELGTTAPQINLQMIRVADEATAQRVREQALQGSDFVRLAAEYSVTPTAQQDGGELGWQLVDLLEQSVRGAVESLPAGGITEIIASDRFFDIYRVAEATADRELDAEQLNTLLGNRLDAWFEEERTNVSVEIDLSESEADWLRDEIVSDAIGRGDPLATPAGTP